MVCRIDHNGAIEPCLFLEAGVAVIPVGPTLAELEPVTKAGARFNAIEAESWNTIHVGRQDDPVPVDRTGDIQVIVDINGDRLTFAPAEGRSRKTVVDGGRPPFSPGQVDPLLSDVEPQMARIMYGGTQGDRRWQQDESSNKTTS